MAAFCNLENNNVFLYKMYYRFRYKLYYVLDLSLKNNKNKNFIYLFIYIGIMYIYIGGEVCDYILYFKGVHGLEKVKNLCCRAIVLFVNWISIVGIYFDHTYPVFNYVHCTNNIINNVHCLNLLNSYCWIYLNELNVSN